MAPNGGVRATRLGPQLQLEVEIVNRAASAVTLMQLNAVLPLGGLRAVSTSVSTCGQLDQTRAVAGTELAPGDQLWLTVNLDVLIICPRPLPVQFSLGLSQAGRPSTVMLSGFPGLGEVSFSGCT